MAKFYVTTPIYYVNDKPHVGHAYTTIAADILARYNRMLGSRVYFLTGTDENSQKNVEAAQKSNETDIKAYIDKMSAVWRETWDELGLTIDDFIRTTEDRHMKAVEKFWQAVKENGDIYEGEYEGWYCVGCETFLPESDLVDGKCPTHKKVPEKLKEKNYFFKLSEYKDALLKHIDQNPDFIQPKTRRNEVRSYVENFMEDVSISRETMDWGIPVPGEEKQRIYVWFDALINYLTAVGYATDEEKFKKFWPADVHLVGKDIIKFHCALWPAMLMSAGIELPKHIFAHGFFTVDGEKMSKSLGNVIDPVAIQAEYGSDVLRYFLFREIKFGGDGDFSYHRLLERYDGELANELGNLVNRVLTMAEKYTDAKVPAVADGFLKGVWPSYHGAMEEFRLHDAFEIVWKVVRETNQFIEQQAPWQLVKMGEKEMLNDTMYVLLESLRHIAWMLLPLMPETANKIFAQLNIDCSQEFSESMQEAWVWGGLNEGHQLKKADPLFPRKESK